ncbi:MAG TPA: tetratricopeptide repeat protein, partial [Longimicrobium sp.]|nr:tetratricopeptide repeat protein [Longimicrobium sp.]
APMPGRRRSDAELPKAPLELAHPMTVPGGEVAGAEMMADSTGPYAPVLFRVLRLVLAWTSGAPAGADPDGLRRLEEGLLARLDVDDLAAPLAVLAATVQTPERDADRSRAAWACMCIAEWALDRGARRTAIAYTQLAALVAPRNARYAWLAARLLFDAGRFRDAEPWYRRAHRVAIWTDDWEGQARALNSLGLSYYERGKYPLAKRHYHRAIKVAQRRNLRPMEAMTTHNLFVLHTEAREAELAEQCGLRAYELYGADHPRLPLLMADFALFWTFQGFYARTLPIFLALKSRMPKPEDRIRLLAAVARAAGGTGNRREFTSAWNEVWKLAQIVPSPVLVSDALYESGIGAANLSQPDLAFRAFSAALDLAVRKGVTKTASVAEIALAKLAAGESPDPAPARDITLPTHSADRLARKFVQSLESVPAGSH